MAGFAETDLSITLEDRQLVVRGRQADDTQGRVFLHRGIAARQFQRAFVLADGVEIGRSEEHTSELQSLTNLVCRLLLEKKKHKINIASLSNY